MKHCLHQRRHATANKELFTDKLSSDNDKGLFCRKLSIRQRTEHTTLRQPAQDQTTAPRIRGRGRRFRRARCSFDRLRLHGTAVPSLRFGSRQPQLVYGAGENAGHEVVHWRFRESGRVAAWRRWTANPEHLTAKELFLSVSLLSLSLDRPCQGHT